MLLNYSVENFRSIKDPLTLSFMAGREQNHGNRLYKKEVLNGRILPCLAIYGGNASGKSNLIQSLSVARNLILRNFQVDEPLPYEPFKLSDECLNRNTNFKFQFIIDQKVFQYCIGYNEKEFLIEELSQLKWISAKRQQKKILFKRDSENVQYKNLVENDFDENVLKVISAGLRKNSLLLHSLLQQAVGKSAEDLSWAPSIRAVYHWFSNCLNIVSNEGTASIADSETTNHVSKLIPFFDTGIESLQLVEIDPASAFREETFVPLKKAFQSMPEGASFPFPASEKEVLMVKIISGEPHFFSLIANHRTDNGKICQFSLGQESEGTRRLLKLLPYFYDMARSPYPKIVFIDEIDKNLHPLLIQKLLKDFSEACPGISAQLAFTTHDSILLDTELLRRDEMYMVQRSVNGGTSGHTITDSKQLKAIKDLRYGDDLKKLYLKGFLGGIPNLSPKNFLNGVSKEQGT